MYYYRAIDFSHAYGILSQASVADAYTNQMPDVALLYVKHLLLGHALELVIKGWLVLKEGTPKTSPKANAEH